MREAMEGSPNLHVAILSSPGTGHLVPVLVLGNRLAIQHNVKVTILAIRTTSLPLDPQLLRSVLGPTQNAIELIQLPPVDISHLINPTTRVATQLCIMVRESLPAVRSALSAMDPRPDAVFADFFCTEALPVFQELNIPAKYLYIHSNAWFTALTLFLQVLDKEISGQYADQTEPLRLPGCKPIRPEDVVDPMLDRNDQQYYEYLRMGKEFCLFDGLFMNTWHDLESSTIKAIKENEELKSVAKVPVYPIGPLIRPVEPVELESRLMNWLDKQPSESVLFVSFGSGGALSSEQITELAWGLELSQTRFIWVLRPPARASVDDNFFAPKKADSSNGSPDYLPEGFLSRTRDFGILIHMWAQQAEILRHPSMGGFLSHCGWNSTLESIISGVPLIAWPLYAEQRQNATLLTEEFGVAVRTKVLPSKKVVAREEIEKLVRTLMESEDGKVMRNKVKKLKFSAENALSKGGSSYNSMCEILTTIAEKLQ